MLKKWGTTIVGGIVIISILLFSLQQIFVKTTLSEQEIINRVESLYNGSVEDITKNARHYNIVFSDGTKVYEVVVDEKQGTFRGLTFLADRAGAIAVNNEADNQSAPNETTTKPSNEANLTDQPAPSSSSSNNVKPPTTTNNGKDSTPPSVKPVRISQSAATQIALKQLNGEVEDIEFYSAADGGYYIVEIETEEQEAALQIHAITGKILSIVYDD